MHKAALQSHVGDWLGVKNSIWYLINDEYVIVLTVIRN